MSPEQVNISVRAVPTEAEYLIECSECGPVEAVPREECDERCLVHLEAHNVDTTVYRRRQ